MKRIALAIAPLLVSGCVTDAQREFAAHLDERANRPVVCRGAEECDAMWGQAIAWISAHSKYRFQVQTERMLSTWCGDWDSMSPCYEIVRAPLGMEREEFQIRVACNNAFACLPDRRVQKAELIDHLLGPMPAGGSE